MQGTKDVWSSERVKELTLSKIAMNTTKVPIRKRSLRPAAIIAGIVLAASVSVSALAASGIIDMHGFFDSIFDSEKATGYVVASDSIDIIQDSTALSIESVKALTDSEYLYINAKFTTLNGEALPDHLILYDGEDDIGEGMVAERFDEYSASVNLMFTTHSYKVSDGVAIVGFDSVYDVYSLEQETSQPFSGTWSIRVALGDEVTPKELHGTFGSDEITATLNGTTVAFSSDEFLQVNPVLSEKVQQTIDSGNEADVNLYGEFFDDELTITFSDGTVVTSIPSFGGAVYTDSLQSIHVSIPFVIPEDVVELEYHGVTFR